MAVKHHSREPIPNTCPDIDKILESLSRIENHCQNYDDNVKSLQNKLDTISDECVGLDTILEQLRKDNEKLRKWGKEEAENYDRLEEEYNALEARMDI